MCLCRVLRQLWPLLCDSVGIPGGRGDNDWVLLYPHVGVNLNVIGPTPPALNTCGHLFVWVCTLNVIGLLPPALNLKPPLLLNPGEKQMGS